MVKFKTKEELDLMSKEEVKNHRYKLLSSGDFNNAKNQVQYLHELEYYQEVRFKEDFYAMHDRWIKKYNENPKDNPELNLIVSISSKGGGKDQLYYMTIVSQQQKIGKAEFIKGVEIEIPNEYKDFKFLMK